MALPAAAFLRTEVQSLKARLEGIRPAMEQAGELLRSIQHEDLQVSSKSNPRDLVTRADRESEAILIAKIQELFPEDSILAEESGRTEETIGNQSRQPVSPSTPGSEEAGSAADQEERSLEWVLDPLDGTVNYTHGSPQYAISAGLMQGTDCVAGAILHPRTGDLYTAITGQGAFKNGKPIQVSGRAPMDQGLVVTGFPYSRQEFLETLLNGIRITLSNARGLRRTGACCVDMAYLAEGIFDAHYEFFLKPWDTAAATCIVREAGGRVTNLAGQEYIPGMPLLVASNGLFHEELLEKLQPLQNGMNESL